VVTWLTGHLPCLLAAIRGTLLRMGWTANDIPDLHGRTAIVTGANSGIGFHTALQLAKHGALVVLGCRDPHRGAAALARLEAASVSAQLLALDLGHLDSVRTFARHIAADHPRVDILVNNAGLMAIPYQHTADGFEMQLGVNHLGHFALTGLLLPQLLEAPEPRVVTVSSTAHRTGVMRFDDLQGEKRYRRWQAYGQSKLANLLFAYELDRRARTAQLPLTSVAAHPGYAATDLQTKGAKMAGRPLTETVMRLGNALLAQSDAAGALPSLYAAAAPGVRGGEFYGPGQLFESRGAPKRVSSSKASHDEVAARRLWDISEELTGVRYEALRAGTDH